MKKTEKKKCGGKKCEKPECNPASVFVEGSPIKLPESHAAMTLRAKCLELALKTTRLEEDAVKWAKRYWEFVARGD